MNKNAKTLLSLIIPTIFGISGCINDASYIPEPELELDTSASQINEIQEVKPDIVYMNPEDKRIIRTPEGANELDLETPLRCNVNWTTQQMVLTLPYIKSAFKLERNGQNDPLPRFEPALYCLRRSCGGAIPCGPGRKRSGFRH